MAKKLRYPNVDGIPTARTAGVIVLLCDENIKIRILEKNKSFIHCEFDGDNYNGRWFATFIQAPPCVHQKSNFPSQLREIGDDLNGALLVILMNS